MSRTVVKRSLARRILTHPYSWILAVLIAAIAFALISEAMRTSACDLYSKSTSPDGRFAIVICRLHDSFSLAMPGQGDDVPGEVRLVDVASGKVLKAKRFELLSGYPGESWTADEVHILQFADWRLPRAHR